MCHAHARHLLDPIVGQAGLEFARRGQKFDAKLVRLRFLFEVLSALTGLAHIL